MEQWFETPPGRYLRDWEQASFDATVADIFGYHALQLGLPGLDALRTNRMPHRWLGLQPDEAQGEARRPDLLLDFHALPLEPHSVDLVAMPHTLERSADPHARCRKADGGGSLRNEKPFSISSPACPFPPPATTTWCTASRSCARSIAPSISFTFISPRP